MVTEIILTVLEIIGTIAFAVSGAFVAIKVRFDIFGVLVIGTITAVGGGCMRDILIGQTPPAIFSRWWIVAIACATALLVFIVSYFQTKKFDEIQGKIEPINRIFDAIGLAAFSVMGTEIAFSEGLSDNVLLSVTLGVMTGCGGGLLRDVLTETMPYIFKKHVYALASIGGALLYYGLRTWIGDTVFPTGLAIVFIISIRLLAAKYLWSLPKIQLDKDEQEK